MSWSVAALLIVLATLVVGFAWWERTRPPARLLALVATLAALAVAGRIAFAPIPNVKPTTDIVFLAGFALGAAPGFATGAVAALASNVFFGQGPWTPWQMLAWGLAGLLGALLARLIGREQPGRVTLALACGGAALSFGVVMDLYQWLTFRPGTGLRGYVLTATTSLPFNLAHIFASIVFCLLFGPALAAALHRFRSRLHVRWTPAPVVAPLLLAVVAAGALAASTPDAEAAAPRASVAYLERAQNDDGGFGAAPGQASEGLFSGWAALGLAAVGRDHPALVGYLERNASTSTDTGAIERTILALEASGADARDAAGRDLVAELVRRQARSGAWESRVNTTSYGVMALRAAGGHPRAVARGATWIARQQNRDGGFSFARRGGSSGIDDTAGALQALAAAGRRDSRAANRAARFLLRRQNRDGGFGLQPGSASNAQSTAFAVQGLLAAGRRPARVRRGGSRSPVQYLRTLVAADGAVRYSRSNTQTPVWVTAQVVTALEGRTLPFK